MNQKFSLKEVDWSVEKGYKSGTENEPLEFYLKGLSNSISLDLLLGYFSSSAIRVLSLGFAKFIYNGGILRMVINDVLSENDKKAVEMGQNSVEINPPIDLNNIKHIHKSLDQYGQHFFKCIAYLINEDRIQIKVISPKDKKGISHYKSGIFSDGNQTVGFKASCNFTAFGLRENLEELDPIISWQDEISKKRILSQNEEFNSFFNGESEIVNYIDAHDIKLAIQSQYNSPDINELLYEGNNLVDSTKNSSINKKLLKTIKNLKSQVLSIASEPKFFHESGPREYQMIAYNRWKENDYKGVFAMATGTGKTITALNCLLSEYKICNDRNSYKAVILVPTISLVLQWEQECKKFNFRNIICVSSKYKWDDNLAFFNTKSKLLGDTSFIVIATYASFVGKKFQSQFNALPEETILIADEAHNLGSPGIIKILQNIKLKKRIGLSATPDRKYDEIGNDYINRFFNDKPPYVFSFSMGEALDKKWLCPYKYYPHIVYLTVSEQDEYGKISKQLMKFFDTNTGKYKSHASVELLLLKRKRIIHKASNKLEAFKEILKEEYKKRGNLDYTLVYVPEGLERDYSDVDHYDDTDDEDKRLIDEFTRAVRDIDDEIMVTQFTSNSKDRTDILKKYENGELHVLTSMKCLDEGVDIPRSELAIFCASSGNPRQFVQRRGRVLRNHHNKNYATIHDLVVIPNINSDETSFQMQQNLVKTELARVTDFAKLAMNKTISYQKLKEVIDIYGLNLEY